MKPIRLALRLLAERQLSERQIARTCVISRQALKDYAFRASEAGLKWPLPDDVDDFALETKLFPVKAADELCRHPQPDWNEVVIAMKRKGGTLTVLHGEYLQVHPEGMKYTRFCQRYDEYKKALRTSMRFDYQGGDAAFVDYAGPTVTIHNLRDGTKATAQIFVGVLGASSKIYADATWSQKLENWLDSHTRMYEAWGGTPRIVVCDNLKSAVLKPDRNDPEIHPAYLDHARHYSIEIVPARPYKPKDKARAERAVQIVERWILFRLRKRIFTSLAELNSAISELLMQVNSARMRRINKSRNELFEAVERPALRLLPAERYVYAEHALVRAGIDHHITYDGHEYSVPHEIRGKQVEVRATSTSIEAFFNGRRQWRHARVYGPGRTTEPSHMSHEHAAYLNWNEDEALKLALTVGENAHAFLRDFFAQSRHMDHKRRTARTIQTIAKEFGNDRTDRACLRAIESSRRDTQFIRELLRNRREATSTKRPNDEAAVVAHDNLRSSEQFGKYIH